MKPCNFPERKRQRQIRALARLDDRHVEPIGERALLEDAVDRGDQRGKRTKKRGGRIERMRRP